MASGYVEAYLEDAIKGDGRAGVRRALNLLDSGVAINGAIVGLLAAAQRETGERWARNEWTVADEHLVSGVTQKALDALSRTVDPPASGGLVVVACAEGDWHSLPAQMFSEMLCSGGFAVACLGASTPLAHLTAVMSRLRPDALAVSCNLPLFFFGLTRMIETAHRQHIPVIAGGRALTAQRAACLGADAWADGADDSATILRDWQRSSPELSSEPILLDPALMELDATASEIAAAAYEALAAAYPPIARYDQEQLARTTEDLAFITKFIAAARLVDDPTVLSDMLGWLRAVLAPRGVPPSAVAAGLVALAPLISIVDPKAGQLALDAS